MRTIVITGGAKGIGRCLVEYFASQGNAVYFIDMDADAVATVTEKLCAKQIMFMALQEILPTNKYCKSLRRE